MDVGTERREYQKQLLVEGQAGLLFVSQGKWDDYLELELPDRCAAESEVCTALGDIPADRPWGCLDLRVYPDQPVRIGVSVVYSGFANGCDVARDERLTAILFELKRASSALDFGDLLSESVLRAKFAEIEPSFGANSEVNDPTGVLGAEIEAPIELSPGPEVAPTVDNPMIEPVSRHRRDSVSTNPAAISIPPLNIEEEFAKAKALSQRGQVHKSLRALDEILRADSAHAEAWLLRHELNTLDHREKRLRREPTNAQAHLEVGFSYLMVDCNEKAVEAFVQAECLKLDPFLPNVLKGVAFHRQGKADRALEAYRKAAKVRPGDNTPGELIECLMKGFPPPPLTDTRPEKESRRDSTGLFDKPSRKVNRSPIVPMMPV